MIRIAAVGDLHLGIDNPGLLRPHLDGLADEADVLLLAGDLTRCGEPEEARIVGHELDGLDVPVVAVLGNHDHHAGCPEKVADELGNVGVVVLEGNAVTVDVRGASLGIAGVKGFGGGFANANATAFGESVMKAFVSETVEASERLEDALGGLGADRRVALLHYSPVEQTLRGERLEIYPFLGSYHLAEAIDRVGADVVFHGHAHIGSEKGVTPGGVRVRNVAQPVLRHAYNVYELP